MAPADGDGWIGERRGRRVSEGEEQRSGRGADGACVARHKDARAGGDIKNNNGAEKEKGPPCIAIASVCRRRGYRAGSPGRADGRRASARRSDVCRGCGGCCSVAQRVRAVSWSPTTVGVDMRWVRGGRGGGRDLVIGMILARSDEVHGQGQDARLVCTACRLLWLW
jgi:hypothetical protein